MPPEYAKLSFPEALFADMKAFFEDHPEFGYRSPSEFIIEAARQRYLDLRRDARPDPNVDRRVLAGEVEKEIEERKRRP